MPTLLEPGSTNPQIRQAQRQRSLEERVAALERNAMAVPVKPGAPVAGEGAEGSIAGDAGSIRLWLRVGNSWHYTQLT